MDLTIPFRPKDPADQPVEASPSRQTLTTRPKFQIFRFSSPPQQSREPQQPTIARPSSRDTTPARTKTQKRNRAFNRKCDFDTLHKRAQYGFTYVEDDLNSLGNSIKAYISTAAKWDIIEREDRVVMSRVKNAILKRGTCPDNSTRMQRIHLITMLETKVSDWVHIKRSNDRSRLRALVDQEVEGVQRRVDEVLWDMKLVPRGIPAIGKLRIMDLPENAWVKGADVTKQEEEEVEMSSVGEISDDEEGGVPVR